MSDIKKVLLENNQYMREYVESDAYQYSKEIRKLRIKLWLNESATSDLVGLTFPEYMLIESGDESVSTSEYKRVRDKLREELNNKQ